MPPSRLLSGLLGALLAACESTPIEVRDQGAWQPGGRAVWRAHRNEGEQASWFGLELDGTSVAGDDDQGLVSGESVVFDGVTFSGPAQLAIDYRLSQVSLAVVGGQDLPGASVRFLVGAAWQELELDLESGSEQADGVDDWWGVLTGAEAQWIPGWWGLDARVAWSVDPDDLLSEMQVAELGLQLAPRSALGLFAGWRWVDLELERDSLFSSDVDLRTDGPTAALRVNL